MEDALGVAIVGYGYWGRNHARVFSELEDATVTIICDQDLNRLQEAGRKYPDARLTSSLDTALAAGDVDAVVVCSPATTHYEVARDCIASGKHILVEKPFTTNSLEAQALTAMAAEAHVTLMVGQTFLFNPGIRMVNQIMTSGEMGRVHYMYSQRTNLGPIRNDVNALWDLAPHDVSIFNQLTDSVPVWVSAVGSRLLRRHLHDVGFITLAYPGDILANIHVSWSDPNKVRQLVVVGSKKRVLFNDIDTVEQVRIFEKGVEAVESGDPSGAPVDMTYGEFRLLVRDGDIRSPRLAAEEPLKSECSHFLECVRTGRPSHSGGRQGTDVVRVMEAIEASLARRGAPVELSALHPEPAQALT